MDVSVKKPAIVLIILLALAAGYMLPVITLYGPVMSTEEAVEMSKNSELVKEGMQIAKVTIEVHYFNSSTVETFRNGFNAEDFERVPEGHAAWEIIWWFALKDNPGGYNVIVVVDAETGVIAYDAKGIRY